MGVRKFTISVAVEVMEQIDEAAERRGVTRSRFISDVLRKAARAHSDAKITRRLDQVFSDPEVTREQRRISRELLAARAGDDAW